MTDAHQDVAGLAAVIRSRGRNNTLYDINRAADRLESLSQALREAEERERELQRALFFWMPGVDMRLDEGTLELAACGASLLAGYKGKTDNGCWGDEILERAFAAESGLAEAMRVIEPFAEIGANLFVSLEDSQKNTMHWAVPTVGQFRAARAFIAGNGGNDGQEAKRT